MRSNREVSYRLDLRPGARERDREGPLRETVPRIARLLALAIRFEGLLRDETVRDYADLARLGKVTRARMTQIMKLALLAPDLQEEILFLTGPTRINERKLRPIVKLVDWDGQRRLFDRLTMPGRERLAHRADPEA